jgi:hypothetical protein
VADGERVLQAEVLRVLGQHRRERTRDNVGNIPSFSQECALSLLSTGACDFIMTG